MKLKDIKDQIGVRFRDTYGVSYMTLFLCAGMIRDGDPIGGEHTTACVVIGRSNDRQAHPGHTYYLQDTTEITLLV